MFYVKTYFSTLRWLIMTIGLLPAATFAAVLVYTYCTGKKVRQNNDFAPLYPDLAAKWDAKKDAHCAPIKFVLLQGGLDIDTSNTWRKVNEKANSILVTDPLYGRNVFAYGSFC